MDSCIATLCPIQPVVGVEICGVFEFSDHYLLHVTLCLAETKCVPMLLSCFSHKDFLHLGVNMYVLHSFISSKYNSGDFIIKSKDERNFFVLYVRDLLV